MLSARQWIEIAGVAVGVFIAALSWQFLAIPREEAQEQGKVVVAATIFPLADIAKQVGGEHVRVVQVLPPGVSEHSGTLTPQQLSALQDAKVIFQIGVGLDDHLVERIASTFPEIKPIAVDQSIAIREFGSEGEHHDAGPDPHYWLTVPNAVKIAETVAGELSQLDPENAAAYQANFEAYVQELNELEKELQQMATSAQHKEFIAVHDAWSYFAEHYGFELVATYEPREGQEPSLQDLQELREIVEEHGLTTFYAEPQKSSGVVSEFMRREFGLKVLTLDPVGGQAGKESYFDLMRANMTALAAG